MHLVTYLHPRLPTDSAEEPESFWGTLKTEHVFHRQYETRQQAMREITEYIEIYYNRQRRQKQLGYLAPAVFERQFYEQ